LAPAGSNSKASGRAPPARAPVRAFPRLAEGCGVLFPWPRSAGAGFRVGGKDRRFALGFEVAD